MRSLQIARYHLDISGIPSGTRFFPNTLHNTPTGTALVRMINSQCSIVITNKRIPLNEYVSSIHYFISQLPRTRVLLFTRALLYRCHIV